jgi:carboxyl-terminal processing protease
VETNVPGTNLPMVVLIDQGTASGSEIVAGALHDAGRSQLVGETTFGTGTVLNQFQLADGSAVILAIQEWLTPAGKTIWHTGLVPDKVVALSANVTPVFPEAERGLTLDQIKASGDQQLLTAFGLLP